jgi:DNA anti-recombination protein RmuC
VVVPDLGKIKDENSKILAILDLTNKRLDDVNTHLVDQSRRIDEVNKRIDEVRAEFTKRFNDTDKRIDDIRAEFTKRFDETNKRIDDIRAELTLRFDEIHSDLINRLDANNARIDRFFETAVTKYEHGKMEERVTRLEHEVDGLRRQLAA